jgi:hypothetical protein
VYGFLRGIGELPRCLSYGSSEEIADRAMPREVLLHLREGVGDGLRPGIDPVTPAGRFVGDRGEGPSELPVSARVARPASGSAPFSVIDTSDNCARVTCFTPPTSRTN